MGENDGYLDRLFAESDAEDDNQEFPGFEEWEIAAERGHHNMRIAPEPRNFPEDENIGWNDFDDVQPSMPFAGGSGLNIGMDSHEPVDFFNLLYDGNMWDIIVNETNLYFTQQHPNLDALPPNSRFRKWTPLTKDSLMVFIALSILMGLVQKTDLDRLTVTGPQMTSTKHQCLEST